MFYLFLNILLFLKILVFSSGKYTITLVVKKNTTSGRAQVLYPYFYSTPNKVIVNNEEVNMDENCEISVSSERTTVSLSWNYSFISCSKMFYNVQSIVSIDLSNFNLIGVVEMKEMFDSCLKLESINFRNFDSSHVTDIYALFYNDSSLLSLDLSNLDFSNVKDMGFLFAYSSIEYINLQNWKTSSLKNMYAMFAFCYNLRTIDLSSFNTSKVENMSALFYKCINLESIDLSNFDSYNLVDMSFMFTFCLNLKNINFNRLNTQNVRNMSVIFSCCKSLISIDLSSFQTENVVDMNNFFYNCIALKDIKFGEFNTQNVIYIYSMFYNCESLTSLDLSHITIPNAKYTYYMFLGCESLTFLDISKFQTSKVKDMDGMFESCSSLTSLNLNNFDTSSITCMDNMFKDCKNLEILEFKNIKINSECTFDLFLDGCNKLRYLNLFSLNEEYSFQEALIDLNDNITICINEGKNIPNIFKFFKELNHSKRDCSENCYQRAKIFYPDKFLCIDKYEYKELVEYNSEYVSSYPEGTIVSSEKIVTKLICDDYYDYEKKECISTIPDGYFCNSTEDKTIDKCHSDCEKCNKKETIGNSNCISCKSPKKLKEGNCVDNCPKGEFEDNGIIKCKCENEKCLSCSEISLSKNLCISCNNEQNFFPKLNDNINIDNFIECYTNPEKFYLNKNIYEPCYESCQTCDKGKENKYHNCKTCASGYNYIIDYNPFNINCYKTCTYYHYFDMNQKKYYCTEEDKCPEKYKLLIYEKKECVDDCQKDDEYNLKFRNRCYQKCPSNTEKIDYFCHIICTKDFPFEMVENQTCVSKCSINEFSVKLCVINYINNEINTTMEDVMINLIQGELVNGFDTSDVDEGDDIVIDLGNTTAKATISSTKNQKNYEKENNNKTSINLEKCESKLREYYKIPEEEYFYLLKLDVPQIGTKVVKMEYEMYHPLNGKNLQKLDLSVCKNIKVDIFIPIEINEDLNKINSSSDYYNDICFALTSERGTDITLKDRQHKFVEENKAICEENCQFTKYNYDTKKAVCSCETKIKLPILPEIKFDKNKLYDSFTDIKNIANLNILKCYKLFFSKKGILENYGCLIIIVIFLIHIICTLIYCFIDLNTIKKTINDIIYAKKNWNYISKINNRENVKFLNSKQNPGNILGHNKVLIQTNNHMKYKAPIIFQFLNKYKNKKKIKIRNHNLKNGISLSKDKINAFTNKFKQIETTGDSAVNLFKNSLNINKRYEYYKNILEFNDYELNEMPYEKAIKSDKRTYFSYYFSLIRKKHLLISFLFPKGDYNSQSIKIDLFFIRFVINITVNALFFNDGSIHKIYEEAGHFNLLYQLPQIIYSSLISGVINSVLNILSLTGEYIIKIKHLRNDIKNKSDEILKIIQKKIMLYFLLCYILLLLFWYYIGCFCAIYRNTQIHLIKDTGISFGTSFISPFFLNLLPGIFRIPSLRKNKMENMYKFSKILQVLI